MKHNLETIEPRLDKKTIEVDDLATERGNILKSPDLAKSPGILDDSSFSDSDEVLNQEIDFSSHQAPEEVADAFYHDLLMQRKSLDSAKLGKLERQLLVRAWLAFVYLTVVRTVHRLEDILFFFVRCFYGLEGIVGIFFIMTRGDIQVFMTYMRCYNRLVTIFCLPFLKKLCKLLTQDGPLG